MSDTTITDSTMGTQADMSHEEMALRIGRRMDKVITDDNNTKAGATTTKVQIRETCCITHMEMEHGNPASHVGSNNHEGTAVFKRCAIGASKTATWHVISHIHHPKFSQR